MRRITMAAMFLGGAALATYLAGGLRRDAAPVAPATGAADAPPTAAAAAPATASAPGGDLKAMLAVGRKARLEAPRRVPAAEARRLREEAIARGPADARNAALRMLALEDRAAADALARRSLGDHVLFAEAARLLLVRPGTAPAATDVALVRAALRDGDHDEASRAGVAALVLELLVHHRSPAAARFAASLQRDPSPRVRAVVARFTGEPTRGAKPPRRSPRAG